MKIKFDKVLNFEFLSSDNFYVGDSKAKKIELIIPQELLISGETVDIANTVVELATKRPNGSSLPANLLISPAVKIEESNYYFEKKLDKWFCEFAGPLSFSFYIKKYNEELDENVTIATGEFIIPVLDSVTSTDFTTITPEQFSSLMASLSRCQILANLSQSVLDNSTTKYPSDKAVVDYVKSYVDNNLVRIKQNFNSVFAILTHLNGMGNKIILTELNNAYTLVLWGQTNATVLTANEIYSCNLNSVTWEIQKYDLIKMVSDINANADQIRIVKSLVQSLNAYTKEEIDSKLSKKVDTVEGKELSTNDYTTLEKEKLEGIEENANNYVLPDDVVEDKDYNEFKSSTQLAMNQIPDKQDKIPDGHVALIDINGKISMKYLPDYLNGQVVCGGILEAGNSVSLSESGKSKLGTNLSSITLTNDPTDLSPNGFKANEGIYYIVGKATEFADLDLNIGDWLISTGNRWNKVDNTDAVSSVNGKTGIVSLVTTDLTDWKEFLAAIDILTGQINGAISDLQDDMQSAGQSIINNAEAIENLHRDVDGLEAGLQDVDNKLDGTDGNNGIVGKVKTITRQSQMNDKKFEWYKGLGDIGNLGFIVNGSEHITYENGELKFNDHSNEALTDVECEFTDYEMEKILSYDVLELNGVARLDGANGEYGFFVGFYFNDYASNIGQTEQYPPYRIGVTLLADSLNNPQYLRVQSINYNANMNGTGGVPTLLYNDKISYRLVKKGNVVTLYLNGYKITDTIGKEVKFGSRNYFALSSGSLTGSYRITYHEKIGLSFYNEEQIVSGGSVTEVETLPNVGENAKLYKVDKDKLYMWVERVATSGEASMGYTVNCVNDGGPDFGTTISYRFDSTESWKTLRTGDILTNVTKIYFSNYNADYAALPNSTGSLSSLQYDNYDRSEGWDITEDSELHITGPVEI